MTTTPRPLTYDEHKAAEAAFLGLPFNPNWTEAGQAVYLGLRAAMTAREAHCLVSPDQLEEFQTAYV